VLWIRHPFLKTTQNKENKMKSVSILTVLFFIGCGVAPSTNYYIKTVPAPKEPITSLAIIPENYGIFWAPSISHRALVTELMDVGFRIVERSNLFSIIEEQKLQVSGLVDDEIKSNNIESRTLDRNSILELGKILAVDHLLLVYIVPSNRDVHMATFRLVEVQTADVITSTTIIAPSSGAEVDIIMKQVALDIAEVYSEKKRIIHNRLFDNFQEKSTIPNLKREEGDKKIKSRKD
jgi:hypothetical protein